MTTHLAADLIKQATELLESAGVADARHDAKALLKAALTDQALSALQSDSLSISEVEYDRFQAFVKRRQCREPLQHITQLASILDLDIKTDARALIPRQDSAALLTLVIDGLAGRKQEPLVIADLGTGSGVLLAECLQYFSEASGIAVERSEAALSLAEENFARLGLANRVTSFAGSWCDWQGWHECDLILSNPPYIRTDVLPALAPEVRDFDPMAALDGGADGLTAYREIISLGRDQMQPGAHLALEIGFDQKKAVSELLRNAGFGNLEHRQDLGGQDRAIVATKS